MHHRSHQEVTQSAQFKQLVAKRWRFSMCMTLLMLLVYFGFLGMVAFAKETLGKELASGMSWAIVLGLAILVFTWLITGVYVRWANTRYDKEVKDLRNKLR